MAEEYGKKIIGKLFGDKYYEESALPEYLMYGKWDAREGLLLLSGISPEEFKTGVLQPLDAAKGFGKISKHVFDFDEAEKETPIRPPALPEGLTESKHRLVKLVGQALGSENTKKDEEEIRADSYAEINTEIRKISGILWRRFKSNEPV